MLDHWFAQSWLLPALTVMPLLSLLAAWARWRRRVALARLGPSAALASLLAASRWPNRFRTVFIGLAVPLLILGVAGPQWGREVEPSAAPGRDLVVVVDCSRSMTAETPSRLARVRVALLDLADSLERSGGNRVALVAFAGKPKVLCPLTRDCDHFRAVVRDLETLPGDPDLAPEPGTASGTRIGAGLQAAVAEHDTRFRGAQDVLLLSDGDDPAHDGEWNAGVAAARAAGVPIHVVGVGNPDEAFAIPDGDGELRHEGQRVLTRLEEDALRDIARRSGGSYVAARTKTVALGAVYLGLVADRPRREETDDAVPTYRPRQLWFLTPAFALLFGAMLLPQGGRASRRPAPVAEPRRPVVTGFRATTRVAGALTASLVLLLLGAAAMPTDPEMLLRDGDAAYERGDLTGAVDLYARALERTSDPPRVAYNLAAVRYRLAVEGPEEERPRQLREAEQLFRACADQPGARGVRARYGLANCLLLRAGGGDRDALAGALRHYQTCLADPNADAELTADVRHNLARARLLALQLGPAASQEENKEQPEKNGSEQPEKDPRKNGSQETGSDEQDPGQKRRSISQKPVRSADRNGRPQESDDPPPPGDGLPTIPDTSETAPLTARDAVEHLERAAESVRRERSRYRAGLVRPPSVDVRDW